MPRKHLVRVGEIVLWGHSGRAESLAVGRESRSLALLADCW
jgi:hypothetical protein